LRIEIPVAEEIRNDLVKLWDTTLGRVTEISNRGFLGRELTDNRNVLYLETHIRKIIGSCMLTTNLSGPKLGAFGHVATDPEFRRAGIATALCHQAVEEFRDHGGIAVLLGTHSPESGDGAAARIYYRLGWRFLAGTNVMINVSDRTSPEEFLVNYFAKVSTSTVCEGSAADRVLMTPLIVTPHDWHILDTNPPGNIHSTRYIKQNSCNGLYRQYEEIREGGKGNWFTARTADGRVVGLASAKLTGSYGCSIDGFVHNRHMDSWQDLILETINWADTQGVKNCFATVCVEDEEKVLAFEQLGFRKRRTTSTLQFGERILETVCMDNEA